MKFKVFLSLLLCFALVAGTSHNTAPPDKDVGYVQTLKKVEKVFIFTTVNLATATVATDVGKNVISDNIVADVPVTDIAFDRGDVVDAVYAHERAKPPVNKKYGTNKPPAILRC